MLKAAKMVQHLCDAIDVNFGCPQEVARRGHYGAFLMDDLLLVKDIVSTLVAGLSIPVSCKIRIFENFDDTLKYACMLEKAGCSILCVHGRRVDQKEEILADWSVVRRLRTVLKIPVMLNGDLWHHEDVRLCMRVTGADSFMSAQGLLHNPALFEPLVATKQQDFHPSPPHPPPCDEYTPEYMRRRRQLGATMAPKLSFSWNKNLGGSKQQTSNSSSSALAPSAAASTQSSFFSTAEDVERQFSLASEYIALCVRFPPAHPSILRRHVFFMLFDSFQANIDLYDSLHTAESADEFNALIDGLKVRAELGKTVKSTGSDIGPNGKPRAKRRDFTLAPPPWPEGGGGDLFRADKREHDKHDKKRKHAHDGKDAMNTQASKESSKKKKRTDNNSSKRVH